MCLYRNAKKESDLETALGKLRDLEAHLNAKDASLATALGEKQILEAEDKDLKAQLVKVRNYSPSLMTEYVIKCRLWYCY